jgi:hypothetical protein
LKRDFIEPASLERVAEVVEASSVDISFIFVAGTIDLVEISIDNPFHPRRGLVRYKL